jgi:hypothetical protein
VDERLAAAADADVPVVMADCKKVRRELSQR